MAVSDRQIQAAFNKGVRDIANNASYNALRDAIARGNYNDAIAAVDIDDSAFDDLRLLLTKAYAESAINELTGRKWDVPVRYNSASPYAEKYARETLGGNITLITNEMRDAVRYTMGDGIAFGRSNTQIARDIVGRIGPSGNRTGGIVGLNAQQSQWAANMRRYIESGDMAGVLGMTKRDKRYDKMIENGGLSATQIDKIVGRYNDRLLMSRGLMIARTERGSAVNIGKMDAWRQAADRTGISHSRLIKTWRHGVAKDPRMWHLTASGTSVVGLDTPFVLSNGSWLLMPHDPNSPAKEVINCTCSVDIRLPRNG